MCNSYPFSGDPDDDAKTKDAECTLKAVAEKYFADRKAKPDMEELNFFYECKDVSRMQNLIIKYSMLIT